MGFASLRSYGGAGFCITEPKTKVRIQSSTSQDIVGLAGLDAAARTSVRDLVDSLSKIRPENPFSLTIEAFAPQHVGFGSKTSLLLSIIAAANAYLKLRLTRGEMQRLSGRGGASGVGVHAFFRGGVICDGGHATQARLLPSSGGRPIEPPPLLARLRFPPEWRALLLLPRERGPAGETEREFFAQNTPIPADEALQTIAALYHGILPAIRTGDLELLAEALARIHSMGFKRREVAFRGPAVAALLGELQKRRLAAGMSSMGPLVYVIATQTDERALHYAEELARACGVETLGVVAGANEGHVLERLR